METILNNTTFLCSASCLPYIPEKGTVGASGDLAPLSHLAIGLMGEGKMWSPESGWASAKDIFDSHNLKPITLEPKEVWITITKDGVWLIPAILRLLYIVMVNFSCFGIPTLDKVSVYN